MSRTFKDQYVKEMMKATKFWYEKMFPKEVMDRFEQSAYADILSGNNVCWIHRNHSKTLSRGILDL